MASDDLRARIAEAIRAAACDGHCGRSEQECAAANPIEEVVSHFGQVSVVEGPVDALAEVAASVVQPELDRRDKRIEEYRESRRRWMEAAYADRRASNAIGEQLNAALAALQAVREAQSLGEALAAVAKHDGLTRNLKADQEAHDVSL